MTQGELVLIWFAASHAFSHARQQPGVTSFNFVGFIILQCICIYMSIKTLIGAWS